MRAVQVSAPGRARIVEVPDPEPVPGEVLVRVEVAAVCATDLKFTARGSDPARIPGHEIAGRLADGTAVGVHPDIGCGMCSWCKKGLTNRCTRRISIGLDRDGGFADIVAVPSDHAVPVDGLPTSVAPLLEPLACCLHAVGLTGAERGDPALVVGAGPMGILCMWALRSVGARVAVCQRSAERRLLAAGLGADAVLGPDGDVREALGDQPRLAIVTAPGGEPLAWATAHIAVGGVVHVFAGSPDGALVDANDVHYRHLCMLGSTGSTLADYRRAVELASSGTIDLEALPRKFLPFESLPHVLAALSRGKVKELIRVKEGLP